jgi:hypothetical protein
MRAAALKSLSVVATVVLATALGWAVAAVPKPADASLHPRLAGGPFDVRPADGQPPVTQTYVS